MVHENRATRIYFNSFCSLSQSRVHLSICVLLLLLLPLSLPATFRGSRSIGRWPLCELLSVCYICHQQTTTTTTGTGWERAPNGHYGDWPGTWVAGWLFGSGTGAPAPAVGRCIFNERPKLENKFKSTFNSRAHWEFVSFTRVAVLFPPPGRWLS